MNDVRSVWTYRDRSFPPHLIPGYVIGGIFTIGILWCMPWRVDEPHYLVLSDGTVIGWDLADPYAPDLIIENRER